MNVLQPGYGAEEETQIQIKRAACAALGNINYGKYAMKPYYLLEITIVEEGKEHKLNVHPFKTDAKAKQWAAKHAAYFNIVNHRVKLFK